MMGATAQVLAHGGARPDWTSGRRLGGLRRFAAAITILNLMGHGLLGFEPSYAQPLFAVAVAYLLEVLLEWSGARCDGRRPRFAGGAQVMTDFLLSAHITGLAIAMLLYSNERLAPIAFAVAVALVSKTLVRVPGPSGGSVHTLNPSNTGIVVTLLMFPWVGITQPYMFTEELETVGDIVLPIVFVCAGTFLNARFTRRLPLIAAWLLGFGLQACVRHMLYGTSLMASFGPMTGVAFLLFTFYMLTDPATTPSAWRAQVVFGASVAAVYGVLMSLHVVFGLFFALAIVCVVRTIGLLLLHARRDTGAVVVPGDPRGTYHRVAAP